MSDQELTEILRFCSPLELYVVSWKNELVKLRCPFKVMVIIPVGDLKAHQQEFVTSVKITRDVKTVFIIGQKAYYYFYFEIVV